MAAHVQYTYRHSYCDLCGCSDRGGGREDRISTCTTTVTVTYVDTLTEEVREESDSTCTVHVLPQLLLLKQIL